MRVLLWLVAAILGWSLLLWLAGWGHVQVQGLDLLWMQRVQHGVLIALPLAEVVLGGGLLALYCIRRTAEQLRGRVTYVLYPSDDFEATEESVDRVVLGLANMPKEVTSWAYSPAMATRVSLMAWGQGEVLMTCSVPAERAGEPVITAWDMFDLELRPLEEFQVPQEPPAATAVPVEEVPDV